MKQLTLAAVVFERYAKTMRRSARLCYKGPTEADDAQPW
jgi:hypothetical protein